MKQGLMGCGARIKPRWRCLLVAGLCALPLAHALAATEPAGTPAADDTTISAAAYLDALTQAERLRTYNALLERQIQSQTAELARMAQHLVGVERTAQELPALLRKQLAALEQFVALDLPFLPEERSQRIAKLKEMLERADVSPSEQYRRLLEAYMVELEYGRSIDAYEGRIGDKTVQFLRAGRVSLAYRSLDGAETGYWDGGTRVWVREDDYRRRMAEAVKIARKQAAPDFLIAPIAAPVETP